MPLEELWKTVLGTIELQVSRPNFVTWLKNSSLLEKNDDIAVIGLPNSFAKEWVENKYHKLVLKALRDLDKTTKKVNYVIHNAKSQSELAKKADQNLATVAPASQQLDFLELKADPQTNLNPRYTLQTFTVGKSNELAYHAGLAVVDQIGNLYNPLFIHGGVGVGKTHLIQAIGNEIKSRYQDKKKVKYISSEKFINDVVSGIAKRAMDSVKEKYRGVDVLIIDDIQYLAGKDATQREFFDTFNALYQNNKQIILSSDRPPAFIEGLEERLKSRFSGGMIAIIEPPEYELRLTVLKNKVREKKFNLNDATIELIASKAQKNFRELEGVLNRIIIYQQHNKSQELDSKMAEQLIGDVIQKTSYTTDPNKVIKCVADYFEVALVDLIGRFRKKELVEPRQIAMYLLRDLLGLSYPYIGEKLGKRDHTTVIYSCEKVEKDVNKNHTLNRKIVMIKDRISKS